MRVGWVAGVAVMAAIMFGGTQVCALALARDHIGSAGLPTQLGPGTSPPSPPAPAVGGAQPYPRNPVTVRVEHVAHEGEQAFGLVEGVTLDYLAGAQIDCQGNVLFAAFLTGPGVTTANDWAIFYGQPGSITKLVREGDAAPCMPEGVVVSSLYYAGERLSETAPGSVSDDQPGWIALTIDVSGPGITSGLNDRILYAGPSDDLQPVLQGGDQAPGCEAGVYIDVSSLGGFLSDHATLMVCAELAGPGVTTLNDYAYWTGTRENMQLAVRTGMQAPGCPTGVTFWAIDLAAHNDAGRLVFRGTLRGTGITSANDAGRWLFDPATGLMKIARESDPVPWFGGAQTWKGIGAALGEINSLGQTGELGDIQGEGVTSENDRILVVGALPDLQVLGREGEPVPEIGPSVYVADFSSFWINNRSEVFYRVVLSGSGITESNRYAMYFGPIGAASTTLRDGDPAPTFPIGVTLARVGALPGLSAMNDNGDVVGATRIQGPGVVEGLNDVVLWMRHHALRRWIPLLRSGDRIEGRDVFAADEYDFALSRTGGADGNQQNLNDPGMVAAGFPFTDGTYGIYRLSPILGDADRDGDLDADDWALLADCLDVGGGSLSLDCAVFDLNADGHVDLVDIGMLQELFQP
jgi:hypothetical protein